MNKMQVKHIDKENIAPFLSSSARNRIDEVSITPGPGAYDINLYNNDTKIGPIISEASDRFPMPVRRNRPLILDQIIPSNEKLKYNQSKFIASRKKLDITKKILQTQSMPSIPSTKANIKNLTAPNGIALFKEFEQKRSNTANSILNDEDISFSDNKSKSLMAYKNATVLYKGTHFNKAKRFFYLMDGTNLPGPGDYDLLNYKYNKYRGITFGSKYKNLAKDFEAFPGPGQYEINENKTNNKKIENLAFMTKRERFDYYKENYEGNNIDSFLKNEENEIDWDTVKAPFGSFALRFPKENTDNFPGPGTYPLERYESPELNYSRTSAVFGSSNFRSSSFWNSNASLPGPADYQSREKMDDPRGKLGTTGSWNFNSKSRRMLFLGGNSSAPPPGWYDTENKGSRRIKNVHFGKPKHQPAHVIDLDNLYYNKEDSKQNDGKQDKLPKEMCGKNIRFGKDVRFKPLQDNMFPGPATYFLSPLLQDTVLKGTFNVKLH